MDEFLNIGEEAAEEGAVQRDSEEVFIGIVKQRSTPMRSLPPESFVLADPMVELPLMQLTLQLSSNSAGNAHETVRLQLWGFWCDRLCEIIQRNDTIRVCGITVEHTPGAQVGERTILRLAPEGAPQNAAVHVDSASRHTEVTRSGICNHSAAGASNTAEASARSHGSAGAAGGAGGGKKKRTRGGPEYTYSRLNELPVRTGGAPGETKEVHLFGVVADYMLPRDTKGTDMKSTILLIDESCSSPQEAYSAVACEVYLAISSPRCADAAVPPAGRARGDFLQDAYDGARHR